MTTVIAPRKRKPKPSGRWATWRYNANRVRRTAKQVRRTIHQVPLRVRLTLWYLLTMSLLIVGMLFVLWHRVSDSVTRQIDRSLDLAANQAAEHLQVEEGLLVFDGSETIERLSADFSLALLAPDEVRWTSPDDERLRLTDLEPGYLTLRSRPPRRDSEDGWRVLTRRVTSEDGTVSGWLVVSQSLDEHWTTVHHMAREVSFLLPIMLALAGVGGFLLARRALRPIDDITRTARAIDASDLSRRIGYDGTNDEVGRLAHTFDHMLDRLQASFERERCFTSDAAHELRTPLTALKGQLGVTLSKKRQPEEYADTLRDMEQQVDRLIRLSNDLLFMARLEQCQRHDPPEEIRVSDLLAALADQVQPLAADKAIALDDHLSPGLDVLGREDLLIRLFTNLLDNAIKYTPSGGRVMLRAWQEDGYVHVDVSDTGPGIAPEHLPHLFERFYRVEGSRVRVQDGGLLVGEEGTPVYGGAGLGLAIAQEIARGHGGSLTVRSTPGAGSTFKVWLPAAARARS